MKQNVCMIAALMLFMLAAGIIDAVPLAGLALIGCMIVPMYIGRLGKRSVSVRDIERRYSNAENR